MLDEREGDVAPADLPRAFNRQSVGKRIAIVAAGPIANLLLAVLLFAGTYIAGVPGQRAVLAEPAPRHAGGRARASAAATSSSPSTASRSRSWQDLRWRLLQGARARARDARSTIERADARGKPLRARRCRCRALGSADWEGNFMPSLGLTRRSRPAGHRRGRSPASPPSAPGIKAGDRIVAIDGVAGALAGRRCRDAPTRKPGVPLDVSHRARRRRTSTSTLTPEARRAGGRKIGIAGVRLKVDPAVADELAVTVRYGPSTRSCKARARRGTCRCSR